MTESLADSRVIGRLPTHLIDQIAAGEVIERPASVVKELVENALDAAATQIDVEVRGAGTDEIRVVDNGIGMTPPDVAVAVERHATSKIHTAEDLEAIHTFGFRGEALAAIASVSHMEIVSRRRERDGATMIFWEGGRLIDERETGAPVGTALTVRHLFFNTPARRAYQKTPTTETKKIIETISDFAASAHTVGFTLTVDKRRVLQLAPAGNPEARLIDLFGGSVADAMLPITAGDAEMGVSGFAGKPELGRATRDRIMIYVNGRRVWSASLAHAATNAYGETLPRGRFPMAVIYLTINPRTVDVNVHPTKREVRFAKDRMVYDLIYYAINRAIFNVPSGEGVTDSHTPPVMHLAEQSPTLRNERLSFSQPSDSPPSISAEQSPHTDSDKSNTTDKSYSTSPPTEPPQPQRSPLRPATLSEADGVTNLWQFDDVYIATVIGDELWIIDQHTAHERIQYEEILRRMDNHRAESQQLLFPESVELDPSLWATFEESVELFGSLGFQVREFGSRTVLLEGIPTGLRVKNPVNLFRRVLEDIAIAQKGGEDLKRAAAASTACRSSVMAGDRLKKEEMQALFARLIQTENPFSCPHGRPTMVKIPITDFDKRFCRK